MGLAVDWLGGAGLVGLGGPVLGAVLLVWLGDNDGAVLLVLEGLEDLVAELLGESVLEGCTLELFAVLLGSTLGDIVRVGAGDDVGLLVGPDDNDGLLVGPGDNDGLVVG